MRLEERTANMTIACIFGVLHEFDALNPGVIGSLVGFFGLTAGSYGVYVASKVDRLNVDAYINLRKDLPYRTKKAFAAGVVVGSCTNVVEMVPAYVVGRIAAKVVKKAVYSYYDIPENV